MNGEHIDPQARPFKPYSSDVLALTRLCMRCQRFPERLQQAMHPISQADVIQAAVATLNGITVGAATVSLQIEADNRRVAHIDNVVSDPAYGGHAIFKALVRACIEIAQTWHCASVVLDPVHSLERHRVYKLLLFKRRELDSAAGPGNYVYEYVMPPPAPSW